MNIQMPRIGECIQVGDVTITVLAVDGAGNEVRFGISAAQQDGQPAAEGPARLIYERARVSGYEH